MGDLLLACGHSLSEVIEVAGEARCGACLDSEPVAAEAVEEADPGDRNGSSDAVIDPFADPIEERVQAEPGEGQEEPRTGFEADDAGERQDSERLAPPQPARGTRGSAPGPRGCWGVNSRGEPCGSFKRRDGDFCNGHAGIGVSADPTRYSPKGHEARREQLAMRAEMRMII